MYDPRERWKCDQYALLMGKFRTVQRIALPSTAFDAHTHNTTSTTQTSSPRAARDDRIPGLSSGSATLHRCVAACAAASILGCAQIEAPPATTSSPEHTCAHRSPAAQISLRNAVENLGKWKQKAERAQDEPDSTSRQHGHIARANRSHLDASATRTCSRRKS